jgi:folate-binding protein YgfZ
MTPQKRPAENNTEAPTLNTRFHIIKCDDDLGYALQLASDYSTRWLYLYHSPVEINNADHELRAQAWHYASVLADEVIVTNATHEELIPQMIEWDRLGGVSFKKGCYPGQEIVARSHYLGKMKRRLFALSTKTASPIAIGTAVVVATHPEQSLGMIVATAYHSEQGYCYALAVLSTDLLEATHIETPSLLGCRTEHGIESLSSISARFPEPANKTAA